MVTASSCSAPRLAGRAESEHLQSSPCEQAYALATRAETRVGADQPVIVRYLAATEARDQWLVVAANCPQRFAEGSLRSAQHALLLKNLAATVHQATDTDDGSPLNTDGSPVNTGTSTISGVDGSVLASMALAEDRAGFAIEVLAARGVEHASISSSDAYKATASRLMSAAAGATDLRQKVYSVDLLLKEPRTTVDAANGLTASTVATIEMDCAREEIEAASHITGTVTGTDSGSTGRAQQGTAALTSARQREQNLLTLAINASNHARSAIELGYPSFDHALFM